MNRGSYARGRGNSTRGRGRGRGHVPKVSDADIEAYLKAKAAEFPALKDIVYGEGSSSAADMIQQEVVYTTSPIIDPIIFISNNDLQYKDPWEIMRRYFDNMSFPAAEGKLRHHYEAMLKTTGSVDFHHHYEKGDSGPMTYSKAIIKKVITPEQWGIHPLKARSMHPPGNGPVYNYNYWDYTEAWYKTFYYQNNKHRHSWFFKLCDNIKSAELPNWFFKWWNIFGPHEDYLPQIIRDEVPNFNIFFPLIGENATIPKSRAFLYFMNYNSIPWIWQWDLKIDHMDDLPILARTFHYKWWSRGMDTDETVIKIKANIDILKKDFIKKDKAPAANPFIEISQKFRQNNPNLSSDDLIIKTMDFMKEQFFETFKSQDDQSMTSAHSGEDSNPFNSLFQDAQDPYEGIDETGTALEDYWDAITSLISEKKKKG